ncbi:MAG: hypothetical protein BMS9Abin36_0105 [Gammaproteobacteria bacterium]|nr:MAG: hypothetical protein BMS9Abin36_0105 [Gammaproteobacteria bacterium]
MKVVFLKDICNFEKGSTGLEKATPGKYPLVATGKDRRSCDSFQFDTKAVCVPLVSSTGHGHASLKNVHYQEGEFALGSILVALTAKSEDVLDIQFLHLYLSELKDKILVPLMSGAANVALSVRKIQNIEIPLPSISRQQEIVVQFKSIAAEEKELNAELTHQQTLLKKLRQSILQEAIEGKLTKDWRAENPCVEPASELLKRIQAEKEQLIKDKKIKKQKPLPPISEEEKPFELPEGWVWCRLGNIILSANDGPHVSPEYSTNGIPFISTRNVSPTGIDFSTSKYITQEYHQTLSKKCKPDKWDILYTKGGTTGIACVNSYDIDFNVWVHVAVLKKPSEMNSSYVQHLLNSPHCYKQSQKLTHGIGNQDLGLTRMVKITTPLPPLPEQKAIVTKVKKLLTLCDQLEIQITNNQTHAEQLMQAVLKEAFSQNNEPQRATAHA